MRLCRNNVGDTNGSFKQGLHIRVLGIHCHLVSCPHPLYGWGRGTCVKTREQCEEVGSLVLLCRPRELNSGYQAWQKAPLPVSHATGPGSSSITLCMRGSGQAICMLCSLQMTLRELALPGRGCRKPIETQCQGHPGRTNIKRRHLLAWGGLSMVTSGLGF